MTRRRNPTPLLLALIAALVGALLFVSVSSASGSLIPGPRFPKTSVPAGAQFVIPRDSGRLWTLRLWSDGKLLGVSQGVSGVLSVPISTTTCEFQADVKITARNGRSYFVTGNRTSSSCCPAATVTSAAF
jgi:hypothetical protein